MAIDERSRGAEEFRKSVSRFEAQLQEDYRPETPVTKFFMDALQRANKGAASGLVANLELDEVKYVMPGDEKSCVLVGNPIKSSLPQEVMRRELKDGHVKYGVFNLGDRAYLSINIKPQRSETGGTA